MQIEEEQSKDNELQHSEESISYIAMSEGTLYDVNDRLVAIAGTIENLITEDRDSWHTLEHEKLADFESPIVFAQMVTTRGIHQSHIRVREKEPANTDEDVKQFEIQIEEWEYLDGSHIAETVSYIIVERGRHELKDGDKPQLAGGLCRVCGGEKSCDCFTKPDLQWS